MQDNLLLVITLGVILIAAVVLMFQLFRSMRSFSTMTQSWRRLAKEYNLVYKQSYGRETVSGMYKGRIINLSGSVKAGITLLVATDNLYNNHLEIKSRGIPPLRSGELDNQFSEGFVLESRSIDFADDLFTNRTLRERLAPLATIQGLSITLSGMELTLLSPKLVHKPEELGQILDIVSDLASAIELIKQH